MLNTAGQPLRRAQHSTLRMFVTAGFAIGLAAGAQAAAKCTRARPSRARRSPSLTMPSQPDLGAMNDKVSSVKIGPRCLMQAYADPNFKGYADDVRPGEHPRLAEGWDDQISSARCNCR